MYRDRIGREGRGARPVDQRGWLLLALAVGVTLVLAACAGGSGDGGTDSPADATGSSSGVIGVDDLAAPAEEPDTPGAVEGAQAAADGGNESSAAQPPEEIAPEDAFLLFAECLREEGLEVSDPDFGSGRGPGGFLQGIDRQDPNVQAALETCRPMLEAARPELTDEQRAELQDAQVAFAACLREQGLEVSDPDFGGGGPGGRRGGIFGGGDIDPQDPDVQAAIEACRDEVPGFGRGRFGGGGSRG